MLIHATAVVRSGGAALLMGRSGAGKSDLALRLIDRGWLLLADDNCRLERVGDRLFAHAPAATAGLIEVRGVGILRLPHIATAPVVAAFELERMPERLPAPERAEWLGLSVPAHALDPLAAAAPLKVEAAFNLARNRLDGRLA